MCLLPWERQADDIRRVRHPFRSTADHGIEAAPAARVLIVDDSLINLQVAKGMMEPYGFAMDTAENGLQAVEMVLRTNYDLIFMGHMMPEMDGADATVSV